MASRDDQPLEFAGPALLVVKMFCIAAGMKFNELRADLGGRVDLLKVRVYEEANFDGLVLHSLPGIGQGRDRSGRVETSFSGDLLPPFWDQANDVWADVESDLHDLGRVTHLEIKAGAHSFSQRADIAVLDMAPIFAQMGSNAVGAGSKANPRGLDWVGLAAGQTAVAGFADRGDMVNVNPKFQGLFCSGRAPGGGRNIGGRGS